MPRVNRNEIFADDEIQVFHLVNRCVRRTFLCGKDDLTGRDFSHRKQWVRDRMEELAGIFGVEVLGFAVMRNKCQKQVPCTVYLPHSYSVYF